MHEAYWGLTEPPFAMTPDPRFLFLAHTHEDALMMLHYGVTRNKGLGVLTGEVGTGKTILLRRLIDILDPIKNRVISLINPSMSGVQFLVELQEKLGGKGKKADRFEVAKAIHESLTECYDHGQRVVIVIDDAHEMKPDVLKQVEMLLHWQMNDQCMANVILAGTSSLTQMLEKHPELGQMAAVRFQFQPLSAAESSDLILHRLRAAGYTGPSSPFTAEAILDAHRFTGGIPRRICQVADNALLLGMKRKFRVIDDVVMHQVTDEFYGLNQAA